MLLRAGKTVPRTFVHTHRGAIRIAIHDMHNRQEMAVDEVACQAALDIFLSEFDVEGWVETYID